MVKRGKVLKCQVVFAPRQVFSPLRTTHRLARHGAPLLGGRHRATCTTAAHRAQPAGRPARPAVSPSLGGRTSRRGAPRRVSLGRTAAAAAGAAGPVAQGLDPDSRDEAASKEYIQ